MRYIQRKIDVLNDKITDSKVYWTILNNFLNKINVSSKVSVIESGKSIVNIVEKANIFYEFFGPQCNPPKQ